MLVGLNIMHKRTESGEKYWWDVPMIKTRFIFAVSMFAMLVVNSAMAATVTTAAPTSGTGQAISGTVGTVGDVYDWSSNTDGYATAGIASVNYVNKAVDAAGNAAQWAERHAAAAGTSADKAAKSAAAAAKSAEAAQNISGDNGVTASIVEGTDGKVTGVKVSGVQATNGAVGVMKLYTKTGQSTDGTMTQKAITDAMPTVNNATLTIKNGATNTNLATFTANSATAVTATIPVATPAVAGLAKVGQIPSGSATSTTYATIWVE